MFLWLQVCVCLDKILSHHVNVYNASVISRQEQSHAHKEKIMLHPPTLQQLLCYHSVFCVGSCWFCLSCYCRHTCNEYDIWHTVESSTPAYNKCLNVFAGAFHHQRLRCVYNHHGHGAGRLSNGNPISETECSWPLRGRHLFHFVFLSQSMNVKIIKTNIIARDMSN